MKQTSPSRSRRQSGTITPYSKTQYHTPVVREGLAYGDVLLVPKKSPFVSRSDADTQTYFTKNIKLSIPYVSANMATVTESKMAIAMARTGGIGIIHQFMPLDEQVLEIKKVKQSTCYVIEEPSTISETATIEEAVLVMKEKSITSLVILDAKSQVVGIFTSRDYLFEEDWIQLVTKVMTPRSKMIVGKPDIDLEEAKKLLHQHRIEKLPLIDEKGILQGLITTQDIKKLEYWPSASRDAKGRLLVGAAIGVKDTMIRAEKLINAGADVLVLDLAHAHADIAIACLKELCVYAHLYGVDVMGGNIATAQAAKDLIAVGVDGLKVGIGPGSICSTRLMTGSGVPQLTAIMDVAAVALPLGIPVCGDGGIIYAGDVTKAIAGGASTVMCGNLLAGTDESPGIIIMKDGRRYKRYIGSASYESSHDRKERIDKTQVKQKLEVFVEGVSTVIDYKGPVEEVLKGLLNGLQSGMSYTGSKTILDVQKNAEFVKLSAAAWQESLTRGIKTADS